MLEVQKYLIETKGDFEGLNKALGIKANFHLSDERVILNYDQILSSKLNPLVRECRALTLNRNDYSLIARSFFRFFNWNEGTLDEMNRFNWDDCTVTEKTDGSLISCFYWNNQWYIQTRNSYGYGYINDSVYTWRELFESALDINKLEPVPGRNYVFELCSTINQVVKIYPKPIAYLLSIFEGYQEWGYNEVEDFSREFSLNRPFSVLCKSPEEVSLEVVRQAQIDRRFEGFVACDSQFNRYKIKSQDYLALSHLSNNGNIGSIKHIVPIILKGEQDEMIAYFPYIEEIVYRVDTIISDLLETLDNFWFVNSVEKSKKSFALGIEKCPLKGILFGVYGKSYEDVDMRKELTKNIDNVIEYVKDKL